MAEEACQLLLQLAVNVLRAADEADRRHTETFIIHRLFRRSDKVGVVGQPKVVVSAKVNNLAGADLNFPALRRGNQSLALHHALGVDLGQGIGDVVQKCFGHESLPFEAHLP